MALVLTDSVFGEQMKLQPMYPETKKIWRKEMNLLLSVVDHIVQFVPSKQMGKNGAFTEVNAWTISHLRKHSTHRDYLSYKSLI